MNNFVFCSDTIIHAAAVMNCKKNNEGASVGWVNKQNAMLKIML